MQNERENGHIELPERFRRLPAYVRAQRSLQVNYDIERALDCSPAPTDIALLNSVDLVVVPRTQINFSTGAAVPHPNGQWKKITDSDEGK